MLPTSLGIKNHNQNSCFISVYIIKHQNHNKWLIALVEKNILNRDFKQVVIQPNSNVTAIFYTGLGEILIASIITISGQINYILQKVTLEEMDLKIFGCLHNTNSHIWYNEEHTRKEWNAPGYLCSRFWKLGEALATGKILDGSKCCLFPLFAFFACHHSLHPNVKFLNLGRDTLPSRLGMSPLILPLWGPKNSIVFPTAQERDKKDSVSFDTLTNGLTGGKTLLHQMKLKGFGCK